MDFIPQYYFSLSHTIDYRIDELTVSFMLEGHPFLLFGFFLFLRQDFSVCVAVLALLELTTVDQAGLELRDPPASVS